MADAALLLAAYFACGVPWWILITIVQAEPDWDEDLVPYLSIIPLWPFAAVIFLTRAVGLFSLEWLVEAALDVVAAVPKVLALFATRKHRIAKALDQSYGDSDKIKFKLDEWGM